MTDANGRTVLSYEDYSKTLIDILNKFEAPEHVLHGVVAMDKWIINDICYRAPEDRSSARDKNRLFTTFCKLDSEPERQYEWQQKAAEFFEAYA
jgi:hypothetical protein